MTIGLFINHAFSSHPEAKDNLKYEECSEEIIIKSDITIKEEFIEDSKNETLGEFNEQILDWYEPELIESSKQPQKKKPTKQKKSKGIKKPKVPDHSVEDIKGSMTSLLTHTVAHSTRPSFRLKTNNQPLKKFLSLAVS